MIDRGLLTDGLREPMAQDVLEAGYVNSLFENFRYLANMVVADDTMRVPHVVAEGERINIHQLLSNVHYFLDKMGAAILDSIRENPDTPHELRVAVRAYDESMKEIQETTEWDKEENEGE